MSDSDTKKAGAPSWQTVPSSTQKPEPEPEPVSESPSREMVLEQAKKFLEEDEVRNASTGKKVAFLEGKGLKSEQIESLLGVSRNTEATAPSETQPSPPRPAQAPPAPPIQSYTSQKRDQPPIITYPEFLTTAAAPSPLVTKSRLLTTLYLFSGVSALLYGTNTYLIEPMLASLTSSRLDLASTTSVNLQRLVTKLESAVSEIPDAGRLREEEEESDEDPSEMFHRDIGVQTSLPTSPRPSSPKPELSHLDDQSARLALLSTSITGLVADSTSEEHTTNDLSTTVSILREYLDGLAYVAPSYGYGAGIYGGGLSGGGKDEDDEIGRVKASIRGVKGVLLSARSFPGGGVKAR